MRFRESRHVSLHEMPYVVNPGTSSSDSTITEYPFILSILLRCRELAQHNHPLQRQRTIAACCAEEQPLLRLITARLDGHVQDMMRVSSTWPFGRDQLDCDPWHYLPELVPGRVFMLTSLPTFSAAISSVAYAKHAAPERVAIVGESVGDRMMFFVEGDGIDLPNARAGCRAP